MKLKTLAITVTVLGGLAGLAWWAQRPAKIVSSTIAPDSKLVPSETAAKLARLELYNESETPVVVLEKVGKSWTVANASGMPADFNKLASFVQSLVDAKVDRDVGSKPEVLARLELDKKRVVFKDAAGNVIYDLKVGKTAPGGGIFAQRTGEPFGLVTSASGYLDTVPNNWTEKKIIATEAPKVKELTVDFGQGQAPLTFTREKEGGPFSGKNLPEGKIARTDEVNSTLNVLLAARFQEPQTDLAKPEVTEARAHATTYTITTFGGDTYTIAMGRQPAPPAPPPAPPAPAAEGESKTPAPAPTPAEAPKPGPVYGFFTMSNPDDAWQPVLSKIAFKFADYSYNSLPTNQDKLLQDKPAETPPPPAAAADSTKVEENPKRVEVTTPPIMVAPAKSADDANKPEKK